MVLRNGFWMNFPDATDEGELSEVEGDVPRASASKRRDISFSALDDLLQLLTVDIGVDLQPKRQVIQNSASVGKFVPVNRVVKNLIVAFAFLQIAAGFGTWQRSGN